MLLLLPGRVSVTFVVVVVVVAAAMVVRAVEVGEVHALVYTAECSLPKSSKAEVLAFRTE